MRPGRRRRPARSRGAPPSAEVRLRRRSPRARGPRTRRRPQRYRRRRPAEPAPALRRGARARRPSRIARRARRRPPTPAINAAREALPRRGPGRTERRAAASVAYAPAMPAPTAAGAAAMWPYRARITRPLPNSSAETTAPATSRASGPIQPRSAASTKSSPMPSAVTAPPDDGQAAGADEVEAGEDARRSMLGRSRRGAGAWSVRRRGLRCLAPVEPLLRRLDRSREPAWRRAQVPRGGWRRRSGRLEQAAAPARSRRPRRRAPHGGARCSSSSRRRSSHSRSSIRVRRDVAMP